MTLDEANHQTFLLLVHSKRHQHCHTMSLPAASGKVGGATVVSVEVETPTYLEVPDFQRVAIIGDYASGVGLRLIFLQSLSVGFSHKLKSVKLKPKQVPCY